MLKSVLRGAMCICGKMLNEIWRLVADDSVRKAMRKIPLTDAEAVNSVFAELSANPYSGDIQKMKGEENVWRRRVRAYRLFYRVYQEIRTVFVYKLERRTSTTY